MRAWQEQMKNFLELTKTLLIFISLTLLTQVGGLIYLFYKPIGLKIKKKFSSFQSIGLRFASFSVLYLLLSFTIIPILASQFDRVPMPVTEQNNIKSGTAITWLANRHYVDPELKQLLTETSIQMPNDIKLIYLDANFPFIDGFPLLPHLSHNDGDKIDLAFIYTNAEGQYLNNTKSLLGYGVVEEPTKNEFDQTAACIKQGHWKYAYLTKFISQENCSKYTFNLTANRKMLNKLAENNKTGKIFIEPHLKKRMKLTSNKFRFHGCQAIRHDDHIHVQL